MQAFRDILLKRYCVLAFRAFLSLFHFTAVRTRSVEEHSTPPFKCANSNVSSEDLFLEFKSEDRYSCRVKN
uniref:Secreted protein n=1 Tax=Steinernema glaseri TaxID=37863 RepID=A0A1I7Z024_9BILA